MKRFYFKINSDANNYIDSAEGLDVQDAWYKIKDSYPSSTAILMTDAEVESYLTHYDRTHWLDENVVERTGG